MGRIVIFGVGVVCAATLAPSPASAAQKVGCPASDKWMHVSLQEAAHDIYTYANNSGFTSEQEVYDLLDAKYDKNGNDRMCVDPVPAAERNPNSDLTWYYLRDDNSNGR